MIGLKDRTNRHLLLVQIETRSFRNLDSQCWSLEGGSYLILGANGAGKTSLLEAIYVLATTRSFRTSQIADCCRHHEAGFYLRGEVETERRSRLDIAWDSGKRLRNVNGKRTSLVEHLSVLPLVCWTASTSDLLTGPPSGRRQFLDRGVVSRHPVSIRVITRYRRAMHEKRQLLLKGGSGIEAWNRVVSEAAAELIRLRAAYTEDLKEALREVLDEACLGIPPVTLRYRSSPRCGLEGAPAIDREMAAVQGREYQLRQPLLGPHRDELEMNWNRRAVRVASAGERKALGLALLAAQGRILAASGRDPIYLLDDVDTELDAARLQSIWSIFGRAKQLLATSNRPSVWSSLEVVHRWRCEAGRVFIEE